MLGQRIIGAILLAVVFVPLGWLGGLPFSLLMGLVAARGVWELLVISHTTLSTFVLMSTSFAVLIPILAHCSAMVNAWQGFWVVWNAMIVASLILLLTRRWKGHLGGSVHQMALSVLALVYVGMATSSLVLVRDFREPITNFLWSGTLLTDGAKTFWTLLLAIWGMEIIAYFSGRFITSTPLAKTVSPSKTWGGSICGLAGAIVVAMLVGAVLDLSVIDRVIIGLNAGVMGQIGDLIASTFKREMGVKDFPYLLPGHGGIIDRFDSLFLASMTTMMWLMLR